LFESKSKENANYVLFGCGGFTIDLINSKRLWHRYNLTWVKNNKTGWLNSKIMVHRNTEDIMLFGKPGHQKTAVFNVPDGYPHPCSALPFDHDRGNGQQGFNFHVTQKPLRLMGYLTMLYSNPNDLVLDCFMGSGTTGDAAIRLGRRFVGIEREKKYFDIACKRIAETVQRKNARYKPRIESPDDPSELEAAEEQLVSVITEEQQDLVQDREEQYNAGVW
jgi:site-specific DNA-methyltransferase (adenine-specific)